MHVILKQTDRDLIVAPCVGDRALVAELVDEF
jgi:hypothetical protein